MIKVWLVVALMTPACFKAEQVKQEEPKGRSYVYSRYIPPQLKLSFSGKVNQQAFSFNGGDVGMSVFVVSRGEPVYTVEGDTECYEVKLIPFLVNEEAESVDRLFKYHYEHSVSTVIETNDR